MNPLGQKTHLSGRIQTQSGQEGSNQSEIKNSDLVSAQKKIREKAEKKRRTGALDMKKFANILGDSFIGNTKDEGGVVSDYAKNWQQILDDLDHKETFLSLGLSSQDRKELGEDFKDLLNTEKASHGGDPKKLLELFKTGIGKRGRFVLHAAIAPTKNGEEGHVFPIIFQKEKNGTILCRILNKGTGCEHHPPCKYEGKFKARANYYPIRLENMESIDLSFFETLVYFATEPSPKKLEDRYKALDIYHLLTKRGELIVEKNSDDEGVTPQRAGTCAMQACRLAMRDYFLHGPVRNLDAYKKLVIFEKTETLFELYTALVQDASNENIPVAKARNALRAYQSSLEKGEDRGILTPEELLDCKALSDLLEEELNHLEKERRPTKQKMFLGSLKNKSRAILEVDSPRFNNSDEKEEMAPVVDLIRETTFGTEPSKDIPRVMQFLREKKASSFDRAMVVHTFFSNLPLADQEKWNSIRKEEIDERLKDLYALSNSLYKIFEQGGGQDVQNSGLYPWLLLDQTTLYGAMMRLAESSPTLKLAEFVPPSLQSSLPNTFYFPAHEDQARWDAVRGSIERWREKKSDGRELGLWECQGTKPPLRELIVDGDSVNPSSQGEHMHYFKQFLLSTKKIEEKDYIGLFASDKPPCIPPLYFSLETCFRRTNELITNGQYAAETFEAIFHSKIHGGIESRTYTHHTEYVYAFPSLWHVYRDKHQLFRNPDIEDPLLWSLLTSSHTEKRENGVSLQTYPAGSLQKGGVYHAFEKILLSDELAISSLVALCEEHPEILDNRSNRSMVENLFFQPDLLIKKISEEPYFIPRLRTLVHREIERNSEIGNVDAALFWIRLGIHIETHIWSVDPNQRGITRLKKILLGLDLLEEKTKHLLDPLTNTPIWSRDICLHKTYVLSRYNPESEEEIARLIENWFLSQTGAPAEQPLSPPWLFYETAVLLRKRGYFSQSKEEKTAVLRGIQRFLRGVSLDRMVGEKAEWHVDLPILSWKKSDPEEIFLFDLRAGQVFHNDKNISEGSFALNKLKDGYEQEQVRGVPVRLFSQGKNRFLSADKKYRVTFDRSGDDLRITRPFSFEGKEEMYTYQRTVSLNLPEDHPLKCKGKIWVKGEGNERWNEGILLDEKSIPLAKIVRKGSTYTLIRVDPEGRIIQPRQTAFFSAGEKEEQSPIPWTEQLYPSSATLFWEDELGLIKEIEFPPSSQPLILSVDREKDIRSNLLGREYILAEEQDRTLVNDLPGSLLFLSKTPGMPRQMILPCKRMIYSQRTLSDQAASPHEREFLLPSEPNKMAYYTYSIDEKHEELVPTTQEGRLYLIYLYLMQRDYLKAQNHIFELHPTQNFSLREQKILYSIFESLQEEANPIAIALQCRLALKCKSYENKAFDRTLQPNLYKWAGSTLSLYVNLRGRGDWNQIPSDLRLKKTHLVSLLQWLEKKGGVPPSLSKEREAIKKEGVYEKKRVATPWDNLQMEYRRWMSSGVPPQRIGWEENQWCGKDNKPSVSPRRCAGLATREEKYLLNQIVLDHQKKDKSIDHTLHLLFMQRRELSRDLRDTLFFLCLLRDHSEEFKQKFYKKAMRNGRIKKESNLKAYHFAAFDEEIGQWAKEKKMEYGENTKEDREKTSSYRLIPPKDQKSSSSALPGKSFLSPVTSDDPFPGHQPFEEVISRFIALTAAQPILPKESERFALESLAHQEDDPIVVDFLRKTEEAHRTKNLSKTHSRPHVNDPKGLASELTVQIKQKSETRKEIERRILSLANQGTIGEKIRMRGRQIPSVTLQDVLLRKRHPRLEAMEEKDREALFALAIEYMDLGTYIDQAEKALRHFEKGEVEEGAKILQWKRLYDPQKNYDLLLYEYLSGNQFRTDPNQVEILQKVFALIFEKPNTQENREEIRNLFFEFQAGGGKTKVLSTIIALRSIWEGKHPVFFSLPDLKDVTRADLQASLAQMFKTPLHSIDINLQSTLDLEQLRKLKKKIFAAHKKGRCDLMTPEAWHTLHLHYQRALIEGESEKELLLREILNHYRLDGIFLIDEAHINLDALLSANIAYGAKRPLPPLERALYLDVWKALMGKGEHHLVDAKGHPITTDQWGIAKNEQAIRSRDALQEIQSALANFFCDHPMAQALDEKEREAYREFLQNPKSAAPVFLEEMVKNGGEEGARGQALILARGMIYSIVPHTLSLVHLMDYGHSEKEGDLSYSPWENKKPSTAKFQSVDVSVAVTIQGHFQNGLTTEEMKKICKEFSTVYQQKKEWQMSDEAIPEYQNFIAWQIKSGIPQSERLTLRDLSESWFRDPLQIETLARRIGKNDDLVTYFLENYCLPTIVSNALLNTSKAADLLGMGAYAAISFSATLGSAERYAQIYDPEKQFLVQAPFLADVMQRSCLGRNRDYLVTKALSPEALFEEIYAAKGFKDLEGWINVGGFAKEKQPFEVADSFLAFVDSHQDLDYQGVVYFKERIDPETGKKEKILFLKRKGDAYDIPLQGSDLKQELPKYDVEASRVFKIYDPSETTGTDLFLTSKAKMLLTMGENVTASRLAQAIMRMRRFLLPTGESEPSQRLYWAIPEVLYQQMERDLGRSFGKENAQENFWIWAIRKEAEHQSHSALASAQQEIEFLFRRGMRQEIENSNGDERKRLLEKYGNAFAQPTVRSPYEIWGRGTETITTEKFLNTHVEMLSSRWNFSPDEKGIREEINRIIQRAERIVKSVESGKTDLEKTSQQREEAVGQEKQKEQQQIRQIGVGLVGASERDYVPKELALEKSGLQEFRRSPDCRSVNDVYQVDLFPETLHVLSNVYRTVAGEDPPQHFKPISYVLLVEENGKRDFFCLSIKDAEEYQRQLIEGRGKGGVKAALFSSDGQIVQKGKGDLSFSHEEFQSILSGKNEEAEEVFDAVAFLNGRVRKREYIEQKYQSDPETFQSFWSKNMLGHLDPLFLQDAFVQGIIKGEMDLIADISGSFELPERGGILSEERREPEEIPVYYVEPAASTSPTPAPAPTRSTAGSERPIPPTKESRKREEIPALFTEKEKPPPAYKRSAGWVGGRLKKSRLFFISSIATLGGLPAVSWLYGLWKFRSSKK